MLEAFDKAAGEAVEKVVGDLVQPVIERPRVMWGSTMNKIYSWQKALVGSFLICLLAITSVGQSNPYDKFRGRTYSNKGLLSEDDEMKLAEVFHQELLKQIRLVENSQLSNYINSLGQKLARHSLRPNIPWRFYVVNDQSFNAFGTLGGRVYVNTGSIAHLNNESQLASVIAVAIGQIVARHGLENIKHTMKYGFSNVQVVTGSAHGVPTVEDFGVLIARTRSRNASREADYLGLHNIQRAGYNTGGMVDAFEILQRASQSQPNASDSIPDSQPPASERAANTRREIDERLRGSDRKGVSDTAKFQRIKGILPVPSNKISRPEAIASGNQRPGVSDTKPIPKDTTPPRIIITSPSITRGIGVAVMASRMPIQGQALDDSGVSEVIIRGVHARLDARGNFSAELLLSVGNNPITVTATDIHGNRASESFTVRRESEPPPPVTGRYFALVIGNNHYPNLPLERQLKTAVNDAQEVAQLLRADYGFEIKLLTDAGREKIIDALNEYRSRSNPDDKLLIYYAGHGHFDDDTKKAYWIPADAKLSSPANWIIADDVTSGIKAIPARHILIVSDSCYSGTLTRATDFKLSTPAERERYLEKMRGGTARLLMASGGNEPVADGGGSGHSVFARALLDGLRGMSERVFTAEELFHEYVKERVAGKSDQTPEYNPLRNSGHEAGDFVFVRVR